MSDERTHLADLSDQERQIIRYCNMADHGMTLQQIAVVVCDLDPTYQQARTLAVTLGEMVGRNLLRLEVNPHDALWYSRYKPTSRGFQAEYWLDARDNGLSAMAAAAFGFHSLEPGEGLFNLLRFPPGTWEKLFVVVDDDTLTEWEVSQSKAATGDSSTE